MQAAAGRWQAIDDLFDAVLERPVSERSTFLDSSCSGDPELRQAVEALLRDYTDAELLLGDSALAFAEPLLARMSPDEVQTEGTPERIGPYHLIREAGRGGMGAVYQAERADDQFRKLVALKLVRRGMDTDEILARFRYERQILASLEHPSVARLLDGGVAPDGRPYLVMEYVEGRPIDRYCDDERLGIDARLALFRIVCDAVQYAHQRLVVHRDIKPSNILVTADGSVKLLDFGIAKLLGDDGADATTPATRTGVRLMTPEHAAPEQIRGDPITTATDVYALGVLLYQLVAGRRPFELSGGSRGELERQVLEQEPVPPSRAAEEGGPAVAERRGTRPAALRRRLRGDLDTIALRALEKAPARRYPTAQVLAEELDRHRRGVPVEARRATLGYRARKYAARHRAGLAVAAAALALATAFGVFHTTRISRERDLAQAEAAKAQATAEFVTGLFNAADPDEARGDTLNVFTLLDRGAARLEREQTGQPAVRAMLQGVLGTLYGKLGNVGRAVPLLDSAHAGQRRLHGERNAATARAARDLALVRYQAGDYAAAESLYRAAADVQRARLGPQDPEVAVTLNGWADMLVQTGKYLEARSLFEEALAIFRALPGDQRVGITTSQFGLATLLRFDEKWENAERLFREVLATRRALYGDTNSNVAVTLNDLGVTLYQKNDLDKADSVLTAALALRRHLFGENHPEVAEALHNLALVPYARRDFATADSLERITLAIDQRLFGPEHRSVGLALNNLGWIASDAGQLDTAVARFRQSLAVMQKASGPESADAALLLANLGDVLQLRGDLAEAEPPLRAALAARRKIHGDEHVAVAGREFYLAVLLAERGKHLEAEQLFKESLARFRRLGPEERGSVARGLSALGSTVLALGRAEEAESLQRRARAIYVKTQGETSDSAAVTAGRVAAALAAQRRYAEAETLLVSGYGTLAKAENPKPANLLLRQLVEVETALGRREEAERYARLLAPTRVSCTACPR